MEGEILPPIKSNPELEVINRAIIEACERSRMSQVSLHRLTFQTEDGRIVGATLSTE